MKGSNSKTPENILREAGDIRKEVKEMMSLLDRHRMSIYKLFSISVEKQKQVENKLNDAKQLAIDGEIGRCDGLVRGLADLTNKLKVSHLLNDNLASTARLLGQLAVVNHLNKLYEKGVAECKKN